MFWCCCDDGGGDQIEDCIGNCQHCPDDFTNPGLQPNAYVVSVSGVASPGFCQNCGDFNGNWVVYQFPTNGTVPCVYVSEPSSIWPCHDAGPPFFAPVSQTSNEPFISVFIVAGPKLRVTFGYITPGTLGGFHTTHVFEGSIPDKCRNVLNLQLTLASETIHNLNFACNFGNAVVTVSSVPCVAL